MGLDPEAVQRFAQSFPVPAATDEQAKRAELQGELLRAVSVAAQARADILRAQHEGNVQHRDAIDWRTKDGAAHQALAALVEFEAGLL